MARLSGEKTRMHERLSAKRLCELVALRNIENCYDGPPLPCASFVMRSLEAWANNLGNIALKFLDMFRSAERPSTD